MTKKIDSKLFASILYIVVGARLLIFRWEMVSIAMTIAGVFFIVSGVLEALKRNYVGGGISAVIGIAILVLGWLALEIVLLVLGILLVIKGLLALLDALKKKNIPVLSVIVPVLTMAAGILVAFGNGLEIVLIIGGVLLVLNGVIGLIEEFNA